MNILRINVLAIALTVLMVANSQAQTWFTNGLVGYWQLNGNTDDASGNANHGTNYGSTSFTDRFGRTNAASWFNGTGTYIQLPVRTRTNNYSISAWINPAAFGQWRVILGNDDENWSGKCLTLNEVGTPIIPNLNPFTRTQRTVSANVATSSNKWQQVVCSVNQGFATFYVNGTWASGGSGIEQYGTFWRIGVKGANITQQPFFGAIDDVRIYNRPLSSNEVASLYYYESKKTAQLVKAYTIDFDGLLIGTNYQLQVSTNLTTWNNWGSPFTATSDRYTNSIPFQRVDDWTKLFFRLVP